MRLIGPRLLVEPIETHTTSGGILLPTSLRDEHNVGGPKLFRVIAVGTGRLLKNGERAPMEMSPGDRVLCHSYFKGPVDAGHGRKIITDDEVVAFFPRNPDAGRKGNCE